MHSYLLSFGSATSTSCSHPFPVETVSSLSSSSLSTLSIGRTTAKMWLKWDLISAGLKAKLECVWKMNISVCVKKWCVAFEIFFCHTFLILPDQPQHLPPRHHQIQSHTCHFQCDAFWEESHPLYDMKTIIRHDVIYTWSIQLHELKGIHGATWKTRLQSRYFVRRILGPSMSFPVLSVKLNLSI